MTINFEITDSETDIIAEQYGYDSKVHGDKNAFVLEKFKEFGRVCILSKARQEAEFTEKVNTQTVIDSAKVSISF